MSTLSNKIASNVRFQKLLHWKIAEAVPGATTIGDVFVQGVRTFQKANGIADDGVFGPESYRMLLAVRSQHLIEEVRHSDGDRKLEVAGRLALTQLKLMWAKNIIDDDASSRSMKLIDALIRTPVGINWHWRKAYTANTFAWCGAAAAGAWRDSIDMATRQAFFSSCYRLDEWFPYEDLHIGDKVYRNPRPKAVGPMREYMHLGPSSKAADVLAFAGTGPRAGDILIIGNTGPGQHICVVDSFDAGTGMFVTYEGNGVGAGPDGLNRDGVSRAMRKLGRPTSPMDYIARRLGRPGLHDILSL